MPDHVVADGKDCRLQLQGVVGDTAKQIPLLVFMKKRQGKLLQLFEDPDSYFLEDADATVVDEVGIEITAQPAYDEDKRDNGNIGQKLGKPEGVFRIINSRKNLWKDLIDHGRQAEPARESVNHPAKQGSQESDPIGTKIRKIRQ